MFPKMNYLYRPAYAYERQIFVNQFTIKSPIWTILSLKLIREYFINFKEKGTINEYVRLL